MSETDLKDEIDDVFRYAFEYPTGQLRNLIVGGLLFLVYGVGLVAAIAIDYLGLPEVAVAPFVVLMLVVNVVVAGYLVRVVRVAGGGGDETVILGDWPGHFKDGVYLVLAMLPWFVGFVVLGFAPLGVALAVGSRVAAFTWLAVYVLAAVVFTYFLPAIIVVYCVEGDWRAAYDVGEISQVSLNWTYAVLGFIYYVLYNIFSFMILLSFVSVIGWAFVQFYVLVITAAFWGRLYYRVKSR